MLNSLTVDKSTCTPITLTILQFLNQYSITNQVKAKKGTKSCKLINTAAFSLVINIFKTLYANLF